MRRRWTWAMEKSGPPWEPPVLGPASEAPLPLVPEVLVEPPCWELPLVRPGVWAGGGAPLPAEPVVEM